MKLPITCVTAIASPRARPSPRMIAATIPLRTLGTTTVFTISQRVAPSAIEPSSSSVGHTGEQLAADRRGDRDRHDRQHDDRGEDRGLGLVLAVGEDRDPAEQRGRGSAVRAGRRTARARRSPRARGRRSARRRATRSASRPAPRTDGGASSLRKRPIAIESGAASSIAPKDVTTVPRIRSRRRTGRHRVPLVAPEEATLEDPDRGPRTVGYPPDDRGDDEDAEQRRESRDRLRAGGRRCGRRPARARRGRWSAVASIAAQHSSAGPPRWGAFTTPTPHVHTA